MQRRLGVGAHAYISFISQKRNNGLLNYNQESIAQPKNHVVGINETIMSSIQLASFVLSFLIFTFISTDFVFS